MTTLRKRARTLETPATPNHQSIDGQCQTNETQKISGYEQFREERIKENLQRMQKLGIFDLSLKLKTIKPTPNNHSSYRRTPQRVSPLPPSEPIRRSSRLQNATPVSYSEVHMTKKDTSFEDDDILLNEGSRPEIYTEEHEKLLGSTEMSWTLFVDGCGKDGKRIYDPVRGKTCHQCRQKTLGHRTHCCKCNMVQGQFCGDCLYMRYGEHVLEAQQNPNWICPACRGICNCSLCRQAKGWPPTGALYRKISNLGFKSVAHYLIQTRRAKTDSDNNASTKVPVSAKRSLPFSDMEATPKEKESPDSNIDFQGLAKRESENNRTDNDFKEHGDGNVAAESIMEPIQKPAFVIDSSTEINELTKPEPEDSKADYEDEKVCIPDNCDSPMSNKKPAIASELKLDVNQAVNCVSLASEAEANRNLSSSMSPSVDSIGARLRLRRKRT